MHRATTKRLITVVGLLGATVALAPAAAPSPPNVVFILADDLGWSDTTLHGTTTLHRTPALERLARRGMTFTRAYSASPLCSPTRAAILTGQSPARLGITAPNCHLPEVALAAAPGVKAAAGRRVIQPKTATRLTTDVPTIARALADAGYATAHIGKWHLGAEPYSPLEHGFDTDVPHWHGPGPAGGYVAPWKFPAFEPRQPHEHIEDRMATEAVAWIERHRDRPFLLNYWMFSVHAPFDGKPEAVERARSRVDPDDAQASPTYAAMVESMDDAVGTLLDALDRLGLADDTIVVFTSDNGGNMYDSVDGTTPTSNRPLRGGKATLFEGGVRVPCIVAWPHVTKPGSTSDVLIQSEDFFPTLLAGLGLAAAPGQRFDGASILPALRGEPCDRGPIFQYFPHDPPVPDQLPPSISIHTTDGWKLIRVFHGGRAGAHTHYLYDLTADIGETADLATREPGRVAALDHLIDAFLERTAAIVPAVNPAFDPAKERDAGRRPRRERSPPPAPTDPKAG